MESAGFDTITKSIIAIVDYGLRDSLRFGHIDVDNIPDISLELTGFGAREVESAEKARVLSDLFACHCHRDVPVIVEMAYNLY